MEIALNSASKSSSSAAPPRSPLNVFGCDLSANPSSSLGIGFDFGSGTASVTDVSVSGSSLADAIPPSLSAAAPLILKLSKESFFFAAPFFFFFHGGGDLTLFFDAPTFFVLVGDFKSFFSRGACGSISSLSPLPLKRSELVFFDDIALNSANKSASSAAPPRSP